MRNEPEKISGTTLAYVDRVNRAIDFVLRHLDQPLNLEAVSKAACFSPFHFHRVFRLLVGESLNEFVKRVRLERAVVLMSRMNWATRRRSSLTDIALACGFGSSADFSRCFKQRYEVPPSRFDVKSFRTEGREKWQEAVGDATNHHLERLKPGANPDRFEVRLRRLPARCVAYIRVLEPFREGGVVGAAERLVRWAEARGLAGRQWLGYMWDDPEITAREKCRYDVGVEVPEMIAEGEVSRMEFAAMQMAELEVRGGIDLEMRALDWLFGTWLPTSGYVPTEEPCFEAWLGRPFAHGTEHFELLLQLPVTRG